MKQLIYVIAIIVLSISANAQVTTLPAVTLKNLATGESTSLDKTVHSGKVTLITFWATTSVDAKREIKCIKDNMDKWRGQADFDYVVVSMDDPKAIGLVETYHKIQKWTFGSYADMDGNLRDEMGIANLPYTIIVGKDGKVAYTREAYGDDFEGEVLGEIKKLAAK